MLLSHIIFVICSDDTILYTSKILKDKRSPLRSRSNEFLLVAENEIFFYLFFERRSVRNVPRGFVLPEKSAGNRDDFGSGEQGNLKAGLEFTF
jgi:hypothetical protein